MPDGLLRECSWHGCRRKVRRGRCFEHQKKHLRIKGAQRGSAAKRLYDARWRKASKAYLALHPLCECKECRESGTVRASEVVDHIIPHRGAHKLFWDRANWRALSKACHDRATVVHDGGFGNPVSEKEL